MSSPQPAKATWNVWGKSTVPTLRAAPVVLFDESSRKEYVSGFTKRKQQRRLIAQVAIKTKEKEMRNDERKKRKQETEEYIQAMSGAKEGEGEGGDFIDTRDNPEVEEAPKNLSAEVGIGTKLTFATEDGGKVTAEVMKFEDSDDEDYPMPGLIPVKKLHRGPGAANIQKPKLRGNTSGGSNVSSSLSSKKRKNDHRGDRKGFQKKSKH